VLFSVFLLVLGLFSVSPPLENFLPTPLNEVTISPEKIILEPDSAVSAFEAFLLFFIF